MCQKECKERMSVYTYLFCKYIKLIGKKITHSTSLSLSYPETLQGPLQTFNMVSFETIVNDFHYCSKALRSRYLQGPWLRLCNVHDKNSSQVFYKKNVLKNFSIFTGKSPVLESLFNKVAGLKTCSFIN